MFRLGLTGSIGMGKSTTAKMFAEQGCAVWDADAAVHELYAKGGAGVEAIGALFPNAIRENAVSRDALKEIIGQTPEALRQIEQIVHPLVGQHRADFVANAQSDIAVFDIPLLFETGGNAAMDAVVCVTAPAEIQKERVMARGTMTQEQFDHILSKQMPDAEKRERADYVVVTDSLENAQKQVQLIVTKIREGLQHA